MSDQYDSPLSSQPGWQGQYSYLDQSEGGVFPFEQGHGNIEPAQPRSVTDGGASQLDLQVKTEQGSPVVLHPNAGPLGRRKGTYPSPIPEQIEEQGDQYATRTGGSIDDGSCVSTGTPRLSMGSRFPVSPSRMGSENRARRASQDDGLVVLKEEDEDDMEDEEVMEGDTEHIPLTAAERTAARRKMKRFR